MSKTIGLLLSTTLMLSAGAASAEEINAQTVQRVADGAVQKARRSIAIGPTVGLGGSYGLDHGGYDMPVSMGLELTWFDVPILDGGELMDAIMEKSKEKALERAKEMIAEGKPAPSKAELEQMAREEYEIIKAEVLNGLAYTPHLVEEPSFRLALESAYLPGGDLWQARLTAGIGVSIFSIGPTVALHWGDGVGVAVGGELDMHLLPSSSVRSPVIDLYVRGEYGIKDDGPGANQIGLGARFQLDLL